MSPSDGSLLYRKAAGKEEKLSFMGHALIEKRMGLVVGGCVTLASGTTERRAAETLITRRKRRRTAASRSVPTRPMTPPITSPICAISASRRMSRKTRQRQRPASRAKAPKDLRA